MDLSVEATLSCQAIRSLTDLLQSYFDGRLGERGITPGRKECHETTRVTKNQAGTGTRTGDSTGSKSASGIAESHDPGNRNTTQSSTRRRDKR